VFKHQTFSIGVENHYDLNRKWKLIGGASFDHSKKNPEKTNPQSILL